MRTSIIRHEKRYMKLYILNKNRSATCILDFFWKRGIEYGCVYLVQVPQQGWPAQANIYILAPSQISVVLEFKICLKIMQFSLSNTILSLSLSSSTPSSFHVHSLFFLTLLNSHAQLLKLHLFGTEGVQHNARRFYQWRNMRHMKGGGQYC